MSDCTFHRCRLRDFADRLPTRTLNALIHAKIETPEALASMTANDLMAVKDIAKRGVVEISQALEKDGLTLKPSPPNERKTGSLAILKARVEILENRMREAGIEVP